MRAMLATACHATICYALVRLVDEQFTHNSVLNGTCSPVFSPDLERPDFFSDVPFFTIFALSVRAYIRIKEKNAFVRTINFNFSLCFLVALDLNPKTPLFKSYCNFLISWNRGAHCRTFVGSPFLRIRFVRVFKNANLLRKIALSEKYN